MALTTAYSREQNDSFLRRCSDPEHSLDSLATQPARSFIVCVGGCLISKMMPSCPSAKNALKGDLRV